MNLRATALIPLPDANTYLHAQRLVDLAARSQISAIYPYRENSNAGGLMSYGIDILDLWRHSATFIDILKGAKASDLPVEQPTRFQMTINLKTAKALGLTIPQSLRLRADEVIE
jgi:putative tryptophan/tyrosine transport system substrate-binding protein